MSFAEGRVRAICFDLDGTLLRDDHMDALVQQVTAEIAARRGLDAVALAAANRRPWEQHWPVAGEAWLRGRVAVESVSIEVWRLAFAEFGIADRVLVQHAVGRFAELETAAFELYPEVPDVLTEVRSRGIRTAIVTNGPSSYQRGKLAAVGVEGFDAVIVSGEVGVAKPLAEIFTAALTSLRVPAADAWHVGDNQTADVAGAREAGLGAIWLDRLGTQRTEVAHATITDLRGLVGLLESSQP